MDPSNINHNKVSHNMILLTIFCRMSSLNQVEKFGSGHFIQDDSSLSTCKGLNERKYVTSPKSNTDKFVLTPTPAFSSCQEHHDVSRQRFIKADSFEFNLKAFIIANKVDASIVISIGHIAHIDSTCTAVLAYGGIELLSGQLGLSAITHHVRHFAHNLLSFSGDFALGGIELLVSALNNPAYDVSVALGGIELLVSTLFIFALDVIVALGGIELLVSISLLLVASLHSNLDLRLANRALGLGVGPDISPMWTHTSILRLDIRDLGRGNNSSSDVEDVNIISRSRGTRSGDKTK